MTERESRSKQTGEPSVDDILESIRRIVFEGDDEGLAPDAGIPEAKKPAADVPAVVTSAAGAGRPASEATARPAAPDVPPDVPPGDSPGDPPDAGNTAAVENRAAAEAGPPEGAALQEPPAPALEGSQESGIPAGPAAGDAGDTGAGNDDKVLLLTDMIAPDGSIVRLGPGPAKAPAPQETPVAAGAGGGEGAGETALDPATQSDLAATVREWMDRNAPGLVDRAAKRELQKLADRQD